MRSKADGKGCENYNHEAAPTVCVESALKDSGSHKRIHDAYDQAQQLRVNQSKNRSLMARLAGPPPVIDGSMSMEETISAAADSHQDAFPLSRCSKRCIEAQLRDFYNKYCRHSRPRVANKEGSEIKSTEAD